MTNTTLRQALERAGLTDDQFADIIGVDKRTVQRWLAGSAPYRRRRSRIARALDIPQHELWPDDTPPASDDAEPTSDANDSGSPPAAVQPDRPVSEVAATWGQTNAPGTPTAVEFLATAYDRIDVLTAGRGLLNADGLLDRLSALADAGTTIRLHANEPTPELEALAGCEHLEIRVLDLTMTHALLRADDRMLLILRLAGQTYPPLIRVDRHTDDGLFDRLIEHFDACWDASEPLRAAKPRRWPGRSA